MKVYKVTDGNYGEHYHSREVAEKRCLKLNQQAERLMTCQIFIVREIESGPPVQYKGKKIK